MSYNRSMRLGVVALVAAFTGLAWTSPTGVSREPVGPAKDRVIVAIPDVFPSHLLPDLMQTELIGVLLRRPGSPDVVVLNPEIASAAALSTAVAALRERRSIKPTPEVELMTLVTSHQVPTERGRPLQRFRAVLNSVERQPKTQIGNIGIGRWAEFAGQSLGL